MDIYECLNCGFIGELSGCGTCFSCNSFAVQFFKTLTNHGKHTQEYLDLLNGITSNGEVLRVIAEHGSKLGLA